MHHTYELVTVTYVVCSHTVSQCVLNVLVFYRAVELTR